MAPRVAEVADSDAAPALRDRPLSVIACMSACVAAYGVYLGLPLILGALADQYGFTNPQIGWIGAAENVGLLLGSAGAAVLSRRLSYRRIAALGITTVVAGNLATLLAGTFTQFTTIRLLAGSGGGMCYSAAIAALSLTRQAARNFSIFVVVLVIANSLELWLLPDIASRWHVSGVYVALTLLYLAPAILLRRLPGDIAAEAETAADAGAGEKANAADHQPRGGGGNAAHGVEKITLAWLCLTAIVLFCIAASAFYAYAERIGLAVGLSERMISNVLTLGNLFSMTGSMLAYPLGRRWGQHRPQLAAIAVMIAVYLLWSLRLTDVAYMAGVVAFFEVWSMVSVFQLSTLAEIDASGRHVALIPAAQGIGQSAGPFLAGWLLQLHADFPQMLLVTTAFALGCLATYAYVYSRLK